MLIMLAVIAKQLIIILKQQRYTFKSTSSMDLNR